MTTNDEIRFIKDAQRLLGDDVETRLLERGWAVTDLEVSDDEPLEWFWPPTAPVSYGGLPEWSDTIMQRQPSLNGARRTPWTRPTRITRAGPAWRLEYGAAVAHSPARPRDCKASEPLLADLERIECWPMSVEETRKLQEVRLVQTTTALAHDNHYLAVFPTEPYASRLNAIRDHKWFEQGRAGGSSDETPPESPRQRGDLTAQGLLLDAEAWASAIRTARVGGKGWGVNGPDDG